MILIRTMRQIRTSGMIASFRACQTLSRLDLSASDRARAIGASAKMLANESRRQWLINQWQGDTQSVSQPKYSQVKPTDSSSETIEKTPIL